MKSTKILVLTVSALLLFSCAKDRPIDTDATDTAEKATVEKRLPRSSFNQETLFYSKATIVKRSDTTPKQWMFVGSAGSLNVGYFKFTEGSLRFYDAVSTNDKDDKITEDDLLYSWDVTYSDYKLKEVNGEVKNVQIEDPDKNWKQKRFFKVNFAKANISARNDIGTVASKCWEQKSAQVVEGTTTLSPEHIAFNVEYTYEYKRWFSWNCNALTDLLSLSPTYTVQIRYSFKPRDLVRSVGENQYQPYVYDGENDPLMKKYGYFKTRLLSKDEDGKLKITWLMNRWNPNTTHTYYFAKDVPEELKKFYTHPEHGIFKKTNDVYAATGKNIRFEIKDVDGTCQFGDVGCSFIKINTEPHNRAPLGYGPSDADPMTGEIIAGFTMIWPDSMKRSIAYYFAAVEKYKKIAPETSTVYRKMKETLGEPDLAQWTKTAAPLTDFAGDRDPKNADIADAYRFLLPQYTYASTNYNWTTFAQSPAKRNHLDELEEMKDFINHLKEENLVSAGMLGDVELGFEAEIERMTMEQEDEQHESSFLRVGQYQGCKGLDETMIAPIKAMVVNGKSAEDIFNTMFYMVAIHELGHTLNLEHNFYGSADIKNFEPEEDAIDINGNPVVKKDEEGNDILGEDGQPIQLKSSASTTSVMEYLDRGEEYDEIHDWGPYDKAAITYAYTAGQRDLAKEIGTDYLFCTHDSSNYMAMCNTWDKGATPSEIAFSLIDGYETRYPYLNYRFDRAIWDTSYQWGRSWGIMWKLKTFMKMQKATFQLGDMQRKLVFKNYQNASVKEIHQAIQADMKQAVKMSLAFYDAQIHQKNADRNFRDTVNEEYGTVEKLGIWPDKVFATIMLYNNHYIGYNPNDGWILTSYLDYLEDSDTELAGMLKNILERGLTERIDEYADVDLWRLLMYVDSTVDSAGTMGEGAIPNVDLAGVQCYRPNTFVDTFGQTMGYEDAQLFELDAANLPEYYQRALGIDGKVKLAVVRQANKVYVASEQQNPFTYKMIKEAATASASYKLMYIRRGARKMRAASAFYNLAIGEEAQYCQ